MYYICIENNQVVSMVNYRPNVPASVQVVEVTDQQFHMLEAGEMVLDTKTGKITEAPQEYVDQAAANARRAEALAFLESTDWKVLRHIRELALGLETSLTQEQYIELEMLRQAASSRV